MPRRPRPASAVPPRRTQPALAADTHGPRPARSDYLAPLLLVLLIGLAWSNSGRVPFLLDDHDSIVNNPTLRDLGSFDWLRPPATGGETVSGRPVLNLSLAINYRWGGLDVTSYHVTNLLIHAGSALLLFGLLRRTLTRAAPTGPLLPAGADPAATGWWAAVIALLWAVHPLQTGAVTYVVQRAESLAGCWTLLSLYAFARATEPTAPYRRWAGLSVVACMLGVATKETAAVTPLLVLLYDRTFVAGGFVSAWRARRPLYLAYTGAWVVLALLVWTTGGRGASAGLDAEIGTWPYLCTQAAAIVRYVRLALWPNDLVFDYGTEVASGLLAILPQALVVLGLLAATGWALVRRPVAGFVGAWFFVTLAPSSSIVPVATQTIAEHRMYLPLAAVVTLISWGLLRLTPGNLRPVTGALAAIGAVLAVTTWARNADYRTDRALWQDTVAKRPGNPRAQHNLGLAHLHAGQLETAAAAFHRTLELHPHHAFAHLNLASVYLRQDRADAALPHLEWAVKLAPDEPAAQLNLGHALTRLGQDEAAIAHYRRYLSSHPSDDAARTNLAGLLVNDEQLSEAEVLLRSALQTSPDSAEAHYHLGRLQEQRQDWTAARAAYRRAIDVRPDFAAAHEALGHVYRELGDHEAAITAFRTAAEAAPAAAGPWFALGTLRASRQDLPAALAAFTAALARQPDHLGARVNLGNCLLALGRPGEAVAAYEEALRQYPGEPNATRNLAVARELLRRDSNRGRP